MKLLSDWGFTLEGWRNGNKGEYWVVAQAFLIVAFILLPIYRPDSLQIDSAELLYIRWGGGVILGLAALVLLAKGLLDLGQQLTPLPYPKADGELVQSGIYSIVRHPLYSGVIFAALSWAIFQVSLSHLIAAAVLLIFLDANASREEAWIVQKYPNYSEYRLAVKKLVPWLY